MRNQGRQPFRKHRVCWTTTISSCFWWQSDAWQKLQSHIRWAEMSSCHLRPRGWRLTRITTDFFLIRPLIRSSLRFLVKNNFSWCPSRHRWVFGIGTRKSNEKQIYFELPLTLSTLTLGYRISEFFRRILPTLVMFQQKMTNAFTNKPLFLQSELMEIFSSTGKENVQSVLYI